MGFFFFFRYSNEPEQEQISNVFMCPRTGDGSSDLGGGGLPHLQRGLLTVPGRVRRADQVRSVFQRALSKTTTHTEEGEGGKGEKDK